MAEVSFTSKVKEEITQKEYSEERKKSLLSAFVRINGSISISSQGETLTLSNENAKTIKFIYQLIQSLFGLICKISYTKVMRFNKKTLYKLVIDEHVDDLLQDLEISFLDGKINKSLIYNDDTVGGYLAGAFLASGSVNSPTTSNYHLEISVDDENYAKWLNKLLLNYKKVIFEGKVSKRRKNYISYLKKSDQISAFLILIGATDACMEFENVRVDRDFSNIGNRWQNCDEANYQKTLQASKNQIEDINLLAEKLGLNNIKNEKMRVLCELRIANEDSTLSELANLLSEKLDKEVSKSNVAHLFRSIHEKAESLRK